MRRLLILLAILVISAGTSWAQCTEETPCPELARLGPWMGGGVPAVAGCTESSDEELYNTSYGNADNVNTATNMSDSNNYTAAKVVLTNTSSITVLIARVSDINQTGNLVMALYNDSGGEPNESSMVAGTEVTVSNTAIADYPTVTEYSFVVTPVVTGLASGTYWMLARGTGTGFSFTWKIDNADNGTEKYCHTSDGSTWTCVEGSVARSKVMGCD